MTNHNYRLINRIAKLVISVSFFAAAMLWRGICALAGKRPTAIWTILYYHSVPAEMRQAFAAQMDALIRLTAPVGIDQSPSSIDGTRYSSITFDDGFEDVAKNAIPELVERNIPATIFVTVDAMGKMAGWWPESTSERVARIVTVDQIRKLPANLVNIGSHTLTHPRLPLLNEFQARRQLSASRAKLEQALQRRITAFSFPYGDFTGALLAWCRDAGYERVYTTLPANALAVPQSFAVGRVPAEPTDWPLEFYLKLLGSYAWLPYAISVKRRCSRLLFGGSAPLAGDSLRKSAI